MPAGRLTSTVDMVQRIKGQDIYIRAFIDGRPIEEVEAERERAAAAEPISFTITASEGEIGPPSVPPARTRVTLDDWIAAKAPLDHAPVPEAPYKFTGGVWVQDWPIPGREPMRRTLSFWPAFWCYSIAQKLGPEPTGAG